MRTNCSSCEIAPVEWLKNEPYIINKVWDRVEVHPFLVPPQFLSLFPKYQEQPAAG